MMRYMGWFGASRSASPAALRDYDHAPPREELADFFGSTVFSGLRGLRTARATWPQGPNENRGRTGMRDAYWALVGAAENDVELGCVWVPDSNFADETFRSPPAPDDTGTWYPCIAVYMSAEDLWAWWCPRQAMDGGYCWACHAAWLRIYRQEWPEDEGEKESYEGPAENELGEDEGSPEESPEDEGENGSYQGPAGNEVGEDAVAEDDLEDWVHLEHEVHPRAPSGARRALVAEGQQDAR